MVEKTESANEASALEFPPLDLTARQLTVRAILTGMVLGGLLSFCNVYAGLKIGWGFNMSVTAAVMSFGFYRVMHSLMRGTPEWGLLENNINQTAASSAASISSAGLVAPIPALAVLTGYEFTWGVLAVWTFSVSLVGIAVAVGLRRQMLLVDKLPFPGGLATAETVRELYSKGAEAMARFRMLVAGAFAGGGMKAAIEIFTLPKLALPGGVAATGAAKAAGAKSISFYNLGFAIDPSPLMAAVGAIIGLRAGLSMMLGAIVSWGFLGPMVLDLGWAKLPEGAPEGAVWFGSIVKWMLWPGVAMMVTHALTSFGFSWRSVVAAMGYAKAGSGDATVVDPAEGHTVSRAWFVRGVILAGLFSVAAQAYFFGVALWVAVVAVLLTFVLAIVAGRVSGETGVTPVGAMGKVTQLTFGVIAPGSVTSNLMTANVTGGAASQCADLLHDMKTGLLIGASPRQQTIAQIFGTLAGALMGSAAYLVIVSDPAMLMTAEWPAPAMAQWKAVAEVFKDGIGAMPKGALDAIWIAGGLGIVLAVLEKALPKSQARFVPSAAAVGLAMVIPAYYAVSMCLGAVVAVAAQRFTKSWATRFLIVLASGIIAGESIVGVGFAIQTTLAGWFGG